MFFCTGSRMFRAGWFGVGLSYFFFFRTILPGVSDLGLNNLELRLNIGSPDADVSSCIINLATLARNQNFRAERFWRLWVRKNLYCLCFVFRVVLFYARSVTQAVTDHLFGSSWVHALPFISYFCNSHFRPLN